MRGMFANGRYLGGIAPVPQLRPRWLLRLEQEQTCDEALPGDSASDHHVLRAWRELELLLHRSGGLAGGPGGSAGSPRRGRARLRLVANRGVKDDDETRSTANAAKQTYRRSLAESALHRMAGDMRDA